VQAKRDTESSIFSKFWMPAFAGMTVLIALSAIATQSRKPESRTGRVSPDQVWEWLIKHGMTKNWIPVFTGMTGKERRMNHD